MAYTFWPSYPRHNQYDVIERSNMAEYGNPYCVCHSVHAWGYNEDIDPLAEDPGVKFYGNNSPHGQIPHTEVAYVTANAQSLVHMKSVDCPGWALYEAMLSGVPVITGRLLNSRMLAYDLLEDGVTCLEFGIPASMEYGRGPTNIPRCIGDVREAINMLKDPHLNREIGNAGKKRLNDLMWNGERDGEEFIEFMDNWF